MMRGVKKWAGIIIILMHVSIYVGVLFVCKCFHLTSSTSFGPRKPTSTSFTMHPLSAMQVLIFYTLSSIVLNTIIVPITSDIPLLFAWYCCTGIWGWAGLLGPDIQAIFGAPSKFTTERIQTRSQGIWTWSQCLPMYLGYLHITKDWRLFQLQKKVPSYLGTLCGASE